MKTYFPPELVVSSAEAHFSRHNKSFRIIYLLAVLLIAVVIVCLPLVWVEITRQGRGVIKTPYEPQQIQSSFVGKVKVMLMHEGQKVLKGDTLIQLNDDHLAKQIILFSSQLVENSTFITDINNLLLGANKPLSKHYQLEHIQYKAKVDEYNINISILKKEFLLAKQLYEEDVIPEMEYMQKKNKYEAATSQLNVYIKQAISNWQQELTQLEQENRKLQSDLYRLKNECDQCVLTAPISGELVQVIGIQAGSIINPGQVLATISADDKLIAECYLPAKDIGFIEPGQHVRLHFDSFNYNEWGFINSAVYSIADDIVIVNNQPVFKVRCDIPVNYLQLKSGQKGYLKKGMTFTGRFVLTNRTLYQLLFDKVDDWLNPKLMKND
jgi:HlyD family secretion protein